MKFAIIFLISAATLAAAGRSKHLFHPAAPLTPPSSQSPRQIADDFLKSIAAADLNLTPTDLAGVYLWKEYRTQHNGVTHLIYRQSYQGIEVHNAEWVINIDRNGQVINAGGNLHGAPAPDLAPPSILSARTAVRAAVTAVNPTIGETYFPFEAPTPANAPTGTIQFQWNGAPIEGRPVWTFVNGQLRPAWMFLLVDDDGISAYETVVDQATNNVLAKEPLTYFQRAAQGLVFTGQNPQPNPAPGTALTAPPPFVNRTLVALTGDPAASPRGWVAGNETAGNNVIAGVNPAGTRYLANPETAVSPSGDFAFPLELGPNAPNPRAFSQAATVNLFYWINQAHDFFHRIGFDEPAGNFQSDNFNRGGNGGDPILAYSQFGAAAPAAAALNNAFFSTRNSADGNASMVAMYLNSLGGFFTDGSFDNEVILHEYTHGVTIRLLRGYGSHQTASMGEAWSDFYALEFTAPEGAPIDGAYPTGEYLTQDFGSGTRTRPYSINPSVNPLTYADMGRVISFPEIHADGEIWVQALWELRANLIRQFGEREGRRRVRLIVLDAIKLSPSAPSFIDMRNAILLADRAGFNSESQTQIWDAFAKRGLGVLAQTASANSAHVLASFERPSPTGAMRFFEPLYSIGEAVRIVLQDSNFTGDSVTIQLTGSSGDLESLLLRRSGAIFLGFIGTSSTSTVNRGDSVLSLMPGDFISAYYLDQDASGSPRLMDITVPTRPGYSLLSSANRFQFSGETPLNFRAPFLTPRRFELPFSFPYYGNRYSSLRIFSNGMLAFDVPPATPCTDLNNLFRYNGIAPLWMEIRTNGAAQPNEDVYVSQTADSITFRWAGETDAFIPGRAAQPVNFAATLFSDGRIQFHYGSGNRNLSNGLSYPGCSPALPTVGISPGTETYAQVVSTHFDMANLENAPTVTFLPPFGHNSIPEGILESPAANDTVAGVMTVRGIAFDSTVPVVRVDILIDGVLRARTFPGAARPDFCAARQAPGCPNVGFNINLNLESLNLAPGAHTIQLRATNANAAFVTFPESPVPFTVEPGQSRLPFGAIETPTGGADLSGTVLIRGWAAANDLRVTAVDILIDGVTYGRAIYGITRSDVCNTLTPRPVNCPLIGFQFSLNTRGSIPLANGQHRLQARIQDETGRLTLIPGEPVSVTVNNEVNELPKGVLTAPAPNERLSGVIAIYGHAWDPDGRILQAQLVVNGEIRGVIPYGRPRPTECSALPDVAACPNIGFEMAFDTRRLNNGPNVIGIRLIDNRGGSVIIPSTLRTGMNVIIANQ